MVSDLLQVWDNKSNAPAPLSKARGLATPKHVKQSRSAVMSIAENRSAKYPYVPQNYTQAKEQGYILTKKVRLEILYKYKGRCYVCGIEEWRLKRVLQMHRVLPAKLGGLYTLDNLVPCCIKCHNSIEGKSFEQIKSMQHPSTMWECAE